VTRTLLILLLGTFIGLCEQNVQLSSLTFPK
jgi:hypothetical protein